MANPEEKERMKQLLMEAVCTLCRSGMKYDVAMRVEGLVAITLDEKDVLVVNINKTYHQPGAKVTESSKEDKEQSESAVRKRKRRKSHESRSSIGHDQSASEASDGETEPKHVKREESAGGIEEQEHMPWMLGESGNQGTHQSPSMNSSRQDPNQSADDTQSQTLQDSTPGQIKIEIESDSEEDLSIVESWDSVVQGQGQLVPMQPSSSATMPISMYSSAAESSHMQPMPGSSESFQQYTTSGMPYPQPTTSADMQEQQQGYHDPYDAQLVEHHSCVYLIFQGYKHRKHVKVAGKVHWRCVLPGCPGRAHTVMEGDKMKVKVTKFNPHSHAPSQVDI